MSHDSIASVRDRSLAHLKSVFGDTSETIIAERRYGFIEGLLKDILKKPEVARVTTSDRIDRVLLHPVWGIPIFLAIIFGIFQFVFGAGSALQNLIETGFARLAEMSAGVSPTWLGSLLGNGIISGVGTVLSFVPNIFFLFISISVLEDCGYMARAAFVMDRAMHRIGLHGRSFIPLMLGFGCTIPAIMACRTIDSPRDRLITILISPFIACGARLPIFVLLAGAFFPAQAGVVVFLMYLIGILVAIVTALFLHKTLFRGESSHFVMELPPYRMPTATGIAIHMWERGRHFLKRAGTVIFGGVVVIWLLANLPWGVDYASAGSWLGRVGSAISPVFIPCGFGQWQAASSLISGFFAKETVVGSLGAIMSVDSGALGASLTTALGWTPLIAFGFMVFCLIYTPCISAVGVLRSETNSWKWAWFSIAYSCAVAWMAATIIYQIGRLALGG